MEYRRGRQYRDQQCFCASALALSSTNVWAAGYYDLFGGTPQTFVEHWDGTKWSIVPSPNAGSSTLPNSLSGIAAITPNNIWVVGQYTYTTSPSYLEDTLAEQWSGTRWSVVSSPS